MIIPLSKLSLPMSTSDRNPAVYAPDTVCLNRSVYVCHMNVLVYKEIRGITSVEMAFDSGAL